MEAFGDRLKLMVKTFRRECHRVLQSERTTILGADSMLMVLQLAMAEVNKKQHGGEFKVSLSDVLMAWKHLLSDKLHLPPGSAPPHYDLILQAYQSFLKRSNAVDLADIFSMYKRLGLEPEEPVSPTQLFEFLSGSMETPEPPSVPTTPSSRVHPCSSQVKMAVRRVFCSYLSLLVNSKNDMAVALTLDVPTRSLDRQAFTNIKHAAQNQNTSLFLAVTSFVRAIQLGGKGYAPAESDPLRKHVKGLSEFVQFIDNLEEILGEIPDPRGSVFREKSSRRFQEKLSVWNNVEPLIYDPLEFFFESLHFFLQSQFSACGSRLVSSIRSALVKGRSSGEEIYIAAEETTTELKERIHQIHQIHKQNSHGTGISPARPRAHAVNHATAYGGRETVKVLMALLDEEAVNPPCPNKADLLSEDQPVLSGDDGSCFLTMFRSPEVPTGCSPEPLRNRVQSRLELLKPKVRDRVIRSQFACTYKDEELPLNRVLDFPSSSQLPTCVHPAPKRRTTAAGDETSSDAEETTTVFAARPGSEQQSDDQRGAALKQRGGNAQNRGAGPGNRKKTGIQMQSKGNKRKQLESDQRDGSENEPPQKKQPSVKISGKNVSKAPSKKKLIAGQGKLTSFFRV